MSFYPCFIYYGTAAPAVGPSYQAVLWFNTTTLRMMRYTGSVWDPLAPVANASGGTPAWGDVIGTLSNQSDLQTALNAKAATSHTHAPSEITGTAVVTADSRLSDARTPLSHGHVQSDVSGLVSALAGKEAANANIQAHVGSAHAPANAQKNSNILKSEIEAVFTGTISTHSHAGGGGGDLDFPETGSLTVATAKYHLTARRHVCTTTQRITVAGTGRLRVAN